MTTRKLEIIIVIQFICQPITDIPRVNFALKRINLYCVIKHTIKLLNKIVSFDFKKKSNLRCYRCI